MILRAIMETLFDNYQKMNTLIAKHHGYRVSPSEPYISIHPNLSEAGLIGMNWQLSAAAFKL